MSDFAWRTGASLLLICGVALAYRGGAYSVTNGIGVFLLVGFTSIMWERTR